MANQSGGSPNLMETVEKLTGKVVNVASRLPGKLKGGPAALGLIVATTGGTAGGAGWELHSGPAGSASNVGIIENVTITDVYAKVSPGHHTDDTLVEITFPKPPDCDTDKACQKMLSYVLGSASCQPGPGGECSTTLKDVDEGEKDNSGDIRRDCKTYMTSHKTVLIVFSGKRINKTSEYANIWQVGPQSAATPAAPSTPAPDPSAPAPDSPAPELSQPAG